MATIPTILYYLSILLMIEGDTQAMASASAALPVAESPRGAGGWRRDPHFSSLALVAVLMAIGMTPFRAVFWASVGAVIVWMLMRRGSAQPAQWPCAGSRARGRGR